MQDSCSRCAPEDTCDVLSSKLSALGGRLPAVDDCILRNGWLLAIDDEPVGKSPHLYRALCKLPLQLLDGLRIRSLCSDSSVQGLSGLIYHTGAVN